MSKVQNNPRILERRRTAAARQAASASRTPAVRLAALDAAFGAGVGATKERARLAAVIAKQTLPAKGIGALPPPGRENEMGKTAAQIAELRKNKKNG